MNRTFRSTTTVREALLNLRGHLLLTLCIALASLGAGAGVVSSSVAEATGILDYQTNAVGRGSTVFTVSAVDNTPISAARCDALNSVPGVVSAGAVVDNRTEAFRLGSSRPAYVTYATPGMVHLIWPDKMQVLGANAGPVVGSSLASEFGIVEGASIPLGSNIYTHTSVATSSSPRDENYDNRILIPLAASPEMLVRTCLVEGVTGSQAEIEALLTGWFPAVPPIFVAPVVPKGTYMDTDEMMRARITQYAGLAAGVLIAVVYGLICTMRRQEYALYHVLGLPPRRRLLMLTAETAASALLPFAIGCTVALALYVPVHGALLSATSMEIAKAAVVMILLPLLGYVITTTGGPIRALKQG